MAKRVVREPPAGAPAATQQREARAQPAVESRVEFRYDGKRLFNGAGCNICHTVDITGGEVGPALTYIARKRNAENLERLLKDPDEINPGGKMPLLYLNELQVRALVSYLSVLK